MSATHGDLPTSKKLTGSITDYYVTDFEKFLAKNPEVFKKKVIVFVDDIKKLNLKPLITNKIKYLILNDSLKDYATDIVKSLKGLSAGLEKQHPGEFYDCTRVVQYQSLYERLEM